MSETGPKPYRHINSKEGGGESLGGLEQPNKPHKKNIVIFGLTGVGKSTIGRLVAAKADMDFVDTDVYIVENKLGGSSIEKFIKKSKTETEGWAQFEELQAEAICELSKLEGIVISTGGRVPGNQHNVVALLVDEKTGRKRSDTFLITAPVDTILERLDRKPNDPNRPGVSKEVLEKRWTDRKVNYLNASDFQVSNDREGCGDFVADLIVEQYRKTS